MVATVEQLVEQRRLVAESEQKEAKLRASFTSGQVAQDWREMEGAYRAQLDMTELHRFNYWRMLNDLDPIEIGAVEGWVKDHVWEYHLGMGVRPVEVVSDVTEALHLLDEEGEVPGFVRGACERAVAEAMAERAYSERFFVEKTSTMDAAGDVWA